MENKNKELLKEYFPSHRLEDDINLRLIQFTAEDLIEFAVYIAKASLEKASEEVECVTCYDNECEVDLKSITNPKNIILL